MQKTSWYRSVLALAFTVGLAGCTNTVQENRIDGTVQDVMSTPEPAYAYTLGAPPALADVMEWGRLPEGAEREAARTASNELALPAMQRGMNLFAQFQQDAETSVARAVENARAALAQGADEEGAFMAAQMLGTLLLDAYLAGDRLETVPPEVLAQTRLDAEQAAAVGLAAELLAGNHFPNADLMAATLTTLQPHWTAERIQANARLAHEAAATYLARGACQDCAAKQGASSDRRIAIRTSMANLQRLASL